MTSFPVSSATTQNAESNSNSNNSNTPNAVLQQQHPQLQRLQRKSSFPKFFAWPPTLINSVLIIAVVLGTLVLSALVTTRVGTMADQHHLVAAAAGKQQQQQKAASSSSAAVAANVQEPPSSPSSSDSLSHRCVNDPGGEWVAAPERAEKRRWIPHACTRRWESRLYTPTFVANELGFWIIVDSWHHRILYRARTRGEADDALDRRPDLVNDWKSVNALYKGVDMLRSPHSVASNGKILVTETSANMTTNGGGHKGHSILVFAAAHTHDERNSRLQLVQVLPACNDYDYGHPLAHRPHKVIFDEVEQAFFVWLTNPAHLARFDVVEGSNGTRLMPRWCKRMPFIDSYSRSISLFKNQSLLITGSRSVSVLDHRNIRSRTLPDDPALTAPRVIYAHSKLWRTNGWSGLNDVQWFAEDRSFWATSSDACRFWKATQLKPAGVKDPLAARAFRPLLASLKPYLPSTFQMCRPQAAPGSDMCGGGGGTPYFMNRIGNRIYMTLVFGCSGIVSWRVPASPREVPLADFKLHHFGTGGQWAETLEDIARRGPPNTW